ncbi:hypothetical protein DPMN_151191 [Dreissena polymorpha]|uniref:Uncharacterized protein n=1 Tax=Dreissena polymorpha TaxID=45954 RepID=A0A9D4FG05_DREPO|nr:hypothetical protein DPMN_151191 [Dreissena polymorpha]
MAQQRATRIPTTRLTQGRPRVDYWPCMVEIDRIGIKEVQKKEVIVKGNFGWVCLRGRGAPGLILGSCIVEIDRIVIREAILEGRPRVGNGAMHKVQYQFEVNRCRNKEIIVKGNFGWVWSICAGRPRIDRFVIREVQYRFEVKMCRNEEIIVKGNFELAWSMLAGRSRVGNGAMHNVKYQFEVNRCRNEEVNEIVARTDRQMDGRTAEITTISPRF